jgi:hypothetical protein
MLRRFTRVAIVLPTSAIRWKRVTVLANEETMGRLSPLTFTRYKAPAGFQQNCSHDLDIVANCA